jgi:hypothetical protein
MDATVATRLLGRGVARREILAAAALVTMAGAASSAPAADSPHARAFDFLHGRWRVRHRKLRQRLAGSSDWFEFPGTLAVDPILGGLGNFDENVLDDPTGKYVAHSLRLYSPDTDQWSIWWLDGRAPELDTPVVGGFPERKGTFYSDDSFGGRPIKVRTTYTPLAPGNAQWTQAFSADGGATWEVNWIMDFERA